MSAREVLANSMSERDLQTNVIAMAKAMGYLVYHTHDSRRSESGYPDLTLARRGEVLFVELKSNKGKLSLAQMAWRAMLPSWRLWTPAELLDGTVERTLR